jgi:3-oxoacyl-[acyl-carrier-protein] synthase-1
MHDSSLAILGAGAVCSVGLDAPAACAAIRAGVAGFAELDVVDRGGQWLRGGRAPVDGAVSGTARRIRLLAMAVREAVEGPVKELGSVAVVLCAGDDLSAADRVAFISTCDAELERHVPHRSSTHDTTVGGGRAAIVAALVRARQLLAQRRCDHVLIGAVDSLLSKRLLASLERDDRLVTSRNSDGFLPGEASAAILVGRLDASRDRDAVACLGLGTANDTSTIANDVPLRANGLALAIRTALAEAGCTPSDLDLRIADLSGEQYYFKEAALALSRVLRQRKAQLHLWNPADCIGEVGTAIGPMVLVLAKAALEKRFAAGPGILCHFSGDQGLRGAIVLRSGAMARS